MKKSYVYSVYRPAGNDTALVLGIVSSPQLRQRINDKIMRQNPNVEQVGFIKTTSPYQLMMAGGEFCGNATRSAALMLLKGKPGKVSIRVSGTTQLLQSGVDKRGNTWTEIPTNISITRKNNFQIVKMEGITHVITPKPPKLTNSDQLKNLGQKIINQFNLLTTAPAAGVIFVSKTPIGIRIDPVVWVRNVKTLFYETACASGTAAVAVIAATEKSSSINNLPIIQPTGKIISTTISINQRNKCITQIKISGPIETLATSKRIMLK